MAEFTTVHDAHDHTGVPGVGGSSSFVGCRVYNSGTQSLTTSTETVLTFDSEEYDTSTLHSTATNTGRITVSATGKWRFHCAGLFSSTDLDGARRIWFRVDGTTDQRGGASASASTAGVSAGVAADASAVLSLTSGQYVEVIGFQNSGSSLTIGHASTEEFQTIFEAEYLGT